MNEIPEIVKIGGTAGGTLILVYTLAKAGLLKLSIGGGNQDEVNGRVEQKLEDLCERMDEMKDDIKIFSARLTQHLKDEESDVRETRNEIRGMKEELKSIKNKI